MNKTRTSRARYKRPATPINVQLTADDLQALWHVYRHRVIDQASLNSLFPNRSDDVMRKRFRKLYDAHLFDRVDNDNRRALEREGSDPLNLVLDRTGAQMLLQDRPALPITPGRVRQKNKELRKSTILHEVEISRFMVQLEIAARSRQGAQVLYPDAFPTLLKKSDEHFAELRRRRGHGDKLRAKVDFAGVEDWQGITPDKLFYIDNGAKKYFMFLELDIGGMTIAPSQRVWSKPSFWRQSSILKKCLVYRQAFLDEEHKKQFGLPIFQVLIVTSTAERARNMRDALYEPFFKTKALHIAPGLFLFTDRESIAAADGDPLAIPFQTLSGNDFYLAAS